MAGRPTKLTPALAAKICDVLSEGNTRDVSCRLAGIGRTAFFSWMAKGRQANAPKLYADFADAVEKAEAEAEAYMVKLVKAAAPTSWQAAMTWLERRNPDEWGRKDRLSIESIKRSEAEKMARELGVEFEEVMLAIDDILAGRN